MNVNCVNEMGWKVMAELNTIEWIENVIFKNPKKLIIVLIKPEHFKAAKIPEMELQVKEALIKLNIEKYKNYEIEMQLNYEKKFLINDIKGD